MKVKQIATGLFLTASFIFASSTTQIQERKISDIVKKTNSEAVTKAYTKSEKQIDKNKQNFMQSRSLEFQEGLKSFFIATNEIVYAYNAQKQKVDPKKLEKVKQDILNKLSIVDKKILKNPESKFVKLIPVNGFVIVTKFEGDIKKAMQIRKSIMSALRINNFVAVRTLINKYKDEIDIVSIILPLESVRKIVPVLKKYVQKGDFEKAFAKVKELNIHLQELVNVIPIPLIKAEADIKKAKEFLIKDSFKNKKEVLNLLNETKYQVKLAKVMGYIPYNSDIEIKFEKQIDSLMDQVEKNNGSLNVFDKLIEKIKNFKIFNQER